MFCDDKILPCQDKLNVTIRPTMVTWDSFGQVQRVIKYKYRDTERPEAKPSFREFVKYLVRFIPTSKMIASA